MTADKEVTNPYVKTLVRHHPHFIDYGPGCVHDMPCPVYWDCGYPAVYDINDGLFQPSWEAQNDGFVILQIRWPRLRRFLERLFPAKCYAGWPTQADRNRGKPRGEHHV